MANVAAASGAFSGRTNYQLELWLWIAAYSGNSSQWYWELKAVKVSGSTSYDLNPRAWAININGQTASGSHTLDMRSTNNLLIANGYTTFMAHDVNGDLWIPFSASMGPAGIFGSASLSSSFLADRIAQVPGAPPAATVTSMTSSAANLTISLPSNNGGSAVIDFFMQLATDAAFTSVIQTRTHTAAAQTFTGLSPNTNYYFRYRARNSVGSGAYSPTTSMTTAVAPPSAPLSPAVSAFTPTGATLTWAAPASNGGQAIAGYRVTRATDAAFTQGVTQYYPGNVLSLAFTDMLPSTTYYFQIEAANSLYFGPATATVSGTTVSGVYYSTGSAWSAAAVFVSNGTTWQPAVLQVSNGTAWIAAV